MNMHQSISAMDVIVLLAIGFTVLFLAAWALSPALRRWIERPKYRFLAEVQSYDDSKREGRL
jgi:hypothetical protein